jgi:hypothetical protein
MVASQLSVHPSHGERLVRTFGPELPSATAAPEGTGPAESHP